MKEKKNLFYFLLIYEKIESPILQYWQMGSYKKGRSKGHTKILSWWDKQWHIHNTTITKYGKTLLLILLLSGNSVTECLMSSSIGVTLYESRQLESFFQNLLIDTVDIKVILWYLFNTWSPILDLTHPSRINQTLQVWSEDSEPGSYSVIQFFCQENTTIYSTGHYTSVLVLSLPLVRKF